MWSEDKYQLESSFETQHWIFIELRHLSSKLSISLFNLYVPIHLIEKKACSQTLSDFLDIYSPHNILVARDLNLVIDPKEKRGGNNGKDQMLPLVEELLLHWDLLDFKPKKGLYTGQAIELGQNTSLLA